MKKWNFENGITVYKRPFYSDLYYFTVFNDVDCETLGFIYPDTVEDMEKCMEYLDAGHDPTSVKWKDEIGDRCPLSERCRWEELQEIYYSFAKKNEDKIKKIFQEVTESLYKSQGQKIDIVINLDTGKITKMKVLEGNYWEWRDCEYKVFSSITSSGMKGYQDEVTYDIVEDRKLFDENGDELTYDKLPKDIQKEIDDCILGEYMKGLYQCEMLDFYKSCGKYHKDMIKDYEWNGKYQKSLLYYYEDYIYYNYNKEW